MTSSSVLPKRDTSFNWSYLPDIPDPLGLSGSFCGVTNNAFIIAGGSNFDCPSWKGGIKKFYDNIYVLEKTNNKYQWFSAGKLPFKIAHGSSVNTPRGILCLGGTNGNKEYDQVFMLIWDSAKKKITIDQDFAPLPESCSYLSSVLVDNKVYVAGGKRTDTDSVEMKNFWSLTLNPGKKGNAWKKLPSWPGPSRFGAILTEQNWGKNKALYLCSGKSGTTYLTDTYQYILNGRTQQWKKKADMPRPALLAPYIAVGKSSVLIFSGSDGHDVDRILKLKYNYHFCKDVLLYNTLSNSWKTIGEMPFGMVNTSLVRWHDKLLIAGGEIHPSVRTSKVLLITIPQEIQECY